MVTDPVGMWTRQFWRETLERALKSAMQAFILSAGGDAISAWDLAWLSIAGIMLAAALLSVATSIISAPLGPRGSASTT